VAGPAKRGLGKGLGALIPTSDTPSSTSADDRVQDPQTSAASGLATYAELPIDSVVPNPRQPRSVFDDDELAELSFSISTIGLLQPIVVRQAGSGYELIAGERRLRASKLAGLVAIPAIIRKTDDEAMLRDALLENLHRSNLNALEEAAAYQQLLADFGCTQDELAKRIGRSRPQISNTLRLLKLSPEVQRRVAAGVLSAGHARALLSMNDSASMENMATRIVSEGLSVRAVEELIILGEGDGQERSRSKRPRASRGQDEQARSLALELAERAGDALDTRASVDGFTTMRSRGRLLIECADLEDLRRITEAIKNRR
jgi:ParB family transcriptional regulator, chromosome partitioning protein